MKGEFLKKLFADAGLEEDKAKDLTDSIMSEYGKDMQKAENLEAQNHDLTDQLSDRSKQLAELKKAAGDNDDLKKQIEDLQSANEQQAKEFKAKSTQQRIDTAVGYALRDAGARNPKTFSGLIDKSKISFDENGKVIGLSDQIENLKKDDTTSFLFKADEPKQAGIKTVNPANPTPDNRPKNASQMSLEEQGKLYQQNPTEWRKLFEK